MHSFCRNLLTVALFSLGSVLLAEPVIHTKVDENPQPLRTPPPEYPAELKQDNISGIVLLDVVVTDDGRVDSAEVVKSTAEAFNAPTLAAVKTWRFRPGKVEGRPVSVRLRLPVKFSPAS